MLFVEVSDCKKVSLDHWGFSAVLKEIKALGVCERKRFKLELDSSFLSVIAKREEKVRKGAPAACSQALNKHFLKKEKDTCEGFVNPGMLYNQVYLARQRRGARTQSEKMGRWETRKVIEKKTPKAKRQGDGGEEVNMERRVKRSPELWLGARPLSGEGCY